MSSFIDHNQYMDRAYNVGWMNRKATFKQLALFLSISFYLSLRLQIYFMLHIHFDVEFIPDLNVEMKILLLI